MKGSFFRKLTYLFCTLAGCLAGYTFSHLVSAEEVKWNHSTKDSTLVQDSQSSVFFDAEKYQLVEKMDDLEKSISELAETVQETKQNTQIPEIQKEDTLVTIEKDNVVAEVETALNQEEEEKVADTIIANKRTEMEITGRKYIAKTENANEVLKEEVMSSTVEKEPKEIEEEETKITKTELPLEAFIWNFAKEGELSTESESESESERQARDIVRAEQSKLWEEQLDTDVISGDVLESRDETLEEEEAELAFTYPAEIFGQIPVINRSDAYVTYFEFAHDVIELVEPEIKQRELNETALFTQFALKAFFCGVKIQNLDINAPISREEAALTLWLAAEVMGEQGSDTSAQAAQQYATDVKNCSASEKKAIAYLYEQGILSGYQIGNQTFEPEEYLTTEVGEHWLIRAKQCWK